MIYIIGDTHFHHDAMIEYCGRKKGFEDKILKNLLLLTKDDILIHLGDICIGKDIEAHDKYIIPLKCKTILVKGNHDSKTDNWYMNHGWDFVCDTFTRTIWKRTVLFSHRPMANNGYDVNIHAHLHNLGHRDGEYLLVKNDKQVLYSCEDNNNRPMSLDYFMGKAVKMQYNLKEIE